MELQAQITQLQQDRDFVSAAPEKQIEYLNSEVLPALDPDFAQAPPEQRIKYIQQEVLPQIKPLQAPEVKGVGEAFGSPPTVMQGLSNLGGAIGQGLSSAGQAMISPQTYQQLGSDAGNAFQSEINNRMTPANSLQGFAEKVFMGNPTSMFMPGALQGVRDLVQGAINLPGDIGNAYMGQQVFKPTELPEVFPELRKRYPVSGFVGEQMPYAFPLTKAAQASKLPQFLKAAGEGAAIGALVDPRGTGLQGRVGNAAMGAALPTALGAAGGATGKVLKGRAVKQQPISMTQIRQATAEMIDPRKGTGALDTDFMPSPKSGQIDLGDMPQLLDEGRAIEYPSAKARLHKGNFKYGGDKIRDKHGKELDKAGFSGNPAGFVEYILKDKNRSYHWDDGNKSIIITRPASKRSNDLVAVEFVYDPEGNYYSAKSAGHWNKAYLKNKKELKVGSTHPDSATRTDTSRLIDTDLETPRTDTLRGRDLSSQSKGSISKKGIEPPTEASVNRDMMPQQEASNAKTSQSHSPSRGKDSPDNTEVRGAREEETLSQSPSTKETASLSGKIREFAVADSDSKKTALAAEIYSMAQEVDRGVFREALKDAPQDVVNDLGKRLGC